MSVSVATASSASSILTSSISSVTATAPQVPDSKKDTKDNKDTKQKKWNPTCFLGNKQISFDELKKKIKAKMNLVGDEMIDDEKIDDEKMTHLRNSVMKCRCFQCNCNEMLLTDKESTAGNPVKLAEEQSLIFAIIAADDGKGGLATINGIPIVAKCLFRPKGLFMQSVICFFFHHVFNEMKVQSLVLKYREMMSYVLQKLFPNSFIMENGAHAGNKMFDERVYKGVTDEELLKRGIINKSLVGKTQLKFFHPHEHNLPRFNQPIQLPSCVTILNQAKQTYVKNGLTYTDEGFAKPLALVDPNTPLWGGFDSLTLLIQPFIIEFLKNHQFEL